MVAKEAEHVRKLNKKTEETCERETYYLLTKKSRKLRKEKSHANEKIITLLKMSLDLSKGRSKCESNMRKMRNK